MSEHHVFYMNRSLLFLLYFALSGFLLAACTTSDKYYIQSLTLQAQKNYLEAALMAEKSVEEGKAHSNISKAELSRRLNLAGFNYSKVGQYDKAISNYQQALTIERKVGRESLIATLLNNIGQVYYSWGKYDLAMDYYQQSLELDRKLGRKAYIAIRLNNIGLVHYSQGKYEKALEYYHQALELDRSLGKDTSVALRLNNIGLVYHSIGQFDVAVEHFQNALEIARDTGESGTEANSLNSLGSVYYSWGQYEKAVEFYHKALTINRQLGMGADIPVRLNNIGMVYLSWGQYEKAIANFQEAVVITKKLGILAGTANMLNNMGQAYNSSGQYAKAVDHFQQALEIDSILGRQAEVAIRLNNIGTVFRTWGEYDKANANFQKALEITSTLGNKAEEATILGNIGSVYFLLGQYDKSIEYLKSSIALIEELRRTATGEIRRDYLASQIQTYQFLAEVYLKANDTEGILQSIEQSRAKLLAERISGIDSDISHPTLDEIQREMQDDESILIFSNIDHDNFILMVITRSDLLVKEISKDSYFARTKKLYKDNILLLLEKQRGISVQPKKNTYVSLENQTQYKADFEKSINYYRTVLIESSIEIGTIQSDVTPFANALYDLLLKPIENKLKKTKKLIIMPDGILGFLPFETLINNEGQYLAETHDIKYTQSLTVAQLLKKRKYGKNRKPMLAFGGAEYDQFTSSTNLVSNPLQLTYILKQVFSSFEKGRSLRKSYETLGLTGWSNLPGTLSEIQNISQEVAGSEIISGDEASENTVKRLSEKGIFSNYKVIHFATHGVVVPSVPDLSALVLSQFQNERDGEDGYLRMGEIAELKIQADFVNLSACETGLGKIYGGEGVVGLTQSFLIAGANGLSVSLWQVADDSTSKFMTELYKKVNRDDVGYDHALAEIKRDFIHGKYGTQYTSPYFWAPFVYYGK